jgi:hypothetical protein
LQIASARSAAGYPWAVGSAPLTLAAGRLWVTRVMLLPVDSRGHSLGQTPACFVLAPQAADFPVRFSQLSIEFRNFPFSAPRTAMERLLAYRPSRDYTVCALLTLIMNVSTLLI